MKRGSPSGARGAAPPAIVGELYGRARELAQLKRALATPGLVTLWGPPGVGKTRLALELAHRSKKPAWFCDVTHAQDQDALLSAVAGELGVRQVTSTPATVASFLARHDAPLLVLDNFEHLVGRCDETLSRLRELAPQARIVLTSRVPLRRSDEAIIEVPPLDLPRPGRDPLESSAVRLLVERIRGGDAVLRMGAGDPPLLGRVAEVLDGLPLAIELAAAHLRLAGLTGAVDRLPAEIGSFEQQADGRPRAPARATKSTRARAPRRHTSMTTALRWSWDLLGADQARALAGCSVFAGGFSAQAAEHVLGERGLGSLFELIERQLVRIVRPGRFQLFEVVRQFASERLDELGERGALELAHEQHYVSSAREHLALFERCGQVDDALLEEQQNLLAVVDRAQETGRFAAASDAMLALAPALVTRGLIAFFRARLERLVPHRPDDARLLHARGFARYLCADFEGAERDLQAALRARPAPVLLATVCKDLGCVQHARRKLKDARGWYERALELLDGEADERLRGVLIGNLGAVDHDLGRFETAEASYQAALKVFRQVGDERLEGIFTTNLGVLDAEQGRLTAARSRYQRALRILASTRDARLEAITLGNLGLLEHALGDLDEARKSYERALDLLASVGERRSEALCRARLAAVLAMQGNVADAETALEAAEESVADRDPIASAVVRLCRAFIDVATGKPARAAARVGEARALDGSPLVDVSDDARVLVGVLARTLSRGAPALEIGDGCAWFRAPGGETQDLRTYAATRRILARLVAQREAEPGAPIELQALFAAGWPSVVIAPESAANRVYVTLANLRKRGLKTWLLHDASGYLLDPQLRVVRSSRGLDGGGAPWKERGSGEIKI